MNWDHVRYFVQLARTGTLVGAAKALDMGVGPIPAVVMGVLTATVGGVIRDVIAQHPSVLLRREIYVTAALVGATVFVVLQQVGLNLLPAGIAGFLAALALRSAAIGWGLTLPGFKANEPDRAD